jgi:L-cysteine S-thiosulfotransferase
MLSADHGNCAICHAFPMTTIPADAFGNLGPPLDHVGSRLSAAQIRLQLLDSRLLNPKTIMPAYHSIEALNDVAPAYVGQTILSAQEIEDVVAYLVALK